MNRLWYLADKVAQQLRRRARFSQDGPIDVEALAHALHVDVRPADILEDGQFVPRQRGGLVLYRSNRPRPRVRFTIAHELVHLALRDPTIGGPAAAQAVAHDGFTSVERLCDCGAAALLMPHWWMRDTFGPEAWQRDPSLGLVLKVARTAAVSPAAAFLRLQAVFAWRRVFLSWTRARSDWLMSSEVGTFVPASDVPRLGDSLGDFLGRVYAHGAARLGSADGTPDAFWDSMPVFHPTCSAFLPAEIAVSCRIPTVMVMIDPKAEPTVMAQEGRDALPF